MSAEQGVSGSAVAEIAQPVRPGTTWYGAEPPDLPVATWPQRGRGVLRLLAFVVMTAVMLPLFVAGRYLRAWAGRWVTFHFHIATLWSHVTYRLCGLRREVTGQPVEAGALVANHSSWIDIPALRSTGLLYFVSKSDVERWPGVGTIARVTGTVFIERRRSQAKRQEAMLRERISGSQRLCFFPEGTSTDGLRVLPFKSSLFSAFFADGGEGADLLIQPVSVRYSVPPGLPPEFYGWWGSMPFGAHVWDVFCLGSGGTVALTFHDPVRPADFSDRKALAEHTGRVVADAIPPD